jgi:hypothetical protein
MREALPIFRLQEAIFDLCRDQPDVAVFGAQAVNLYVSQPRMTQDVGLLCAHPEVIATSLAGRLGDLFHIATRVGELRLAEFPLTDLVERDQGRGRSRGPAPHAAGPSGVA